MTVFFVADMRNYDSEEYEVAAFAVSLSYRKRVVMSYNPALSMLPFSRAPDLFFFLVCFIYYFWWGNRVVCGLNATIAKGRRVGATGDIPHWSLYTLPTLLVCTRIRDMSLKVYTDFFIR